MENLSTHSLHFLLYFEAQVSVAGPPAFACANLAASLLRSFMPLEHPLRACECDLVIMTARGLHVAVPILCGRPRCGHRACHLAARWRCGLGARASCSLCSAHLLSTTFPVCPLPRHRAPPVYLYPVPQVDSRACDGKAVTSRKTSWTAETAPGYHHHHHPHPRLPRDCELAESLLNSDPSSPPWPKNHSQTIQ